MKKDEQCCHNRLIQTPNVVDLQFRSSPMLPVALGKCVLSILIRYGLYGKDEMTQKDVASLLGISQSYISRIEKKVIKKLKALNK